ncbi:MAG: hypothetical protein IJ365_08510 [Clostridia bacterium]|nr:hypothetical protein [Clostridia bacterium]
MSTNTNDNNLVDVQYKAVTLNEGVNVVEISDIDTYGADSVFAYVWNDFEKLTPISAEINVLS